MDLNFEIPLDLVYEMQRKLGSFDELQRYNSTYCSTQVQSKKTLIKGLKQVLEDRPYRFFIIGPWYGTLIVPYLLNNFNVEKLTLVDIDVSVRRLLKSYTKAQCSEYHIDDYNVFETSHWIDELTDNTVIVNTSSEHMPNMRDLNIDKDVVYAIQSNNYYDHPEHINCVSDVEELALKSGINHVMFQDQLAFEKYTRFTIVGKR